MVTRTATAFVLLAGSLLSVHDVRGQQIRGRVLDDSTGHPLAGVLVEVPSASVAATTDLTGTFLLELPGEGLVRLRLAGAGYAPLESDTIRVLSGLTATVVLRLKRTVIPIDTIVAEADARRAGGFYERVRQPGFGRFITRADIDTRHGTNRVSELLRGQPGVEVVAVRRPRSASTVDLLVMNGPLGRCQPTIYIDGSLVKQFPESGLDDFLKPDMLEGVEIYARPGSAPPFFAGPATCGVVAFWTRTGSGEGAQKWTLKRVLTAAGIAGTLLLLVSLGR